MTFTNYSNQNNETRICNVCGGSVPKGAMYCSRCGNRIEEINVYYNNNIQGNSNTYNNNQVNTKKDKKSKNIAIIGGIILVAIALACFMLLGEKHYECISDKVYAYGDELKGPTDISRISLDISPAVIRNNTKIKLNYYGKTYTAVYYDGFVLWDNEPRLMDGGSEAYTTISKNGKQITLTVTENYPIGGQSYYLEIRMKFER